MRSNQPGSAAEVMDDGVTCSGTRVMHDRRAIAVMLPVGSFHIALHDRRAVAVMLPVGSFHLVLMLR
jgi:hypothetical protein